MKRIDDTILIGSVSIILLLLTRIVSIWIVLPILVIFNTALIWKKIKVHRDRIKSIQDRLSNMKGEGLFLKEKFKENEGNVFYEMTITLLSDLERSLYKLVEKNIQLLSMKEIGRNIVSSLDEQKLVESVINYLTHGIGYREIAIVLLRKKRGVFQSVVVIERNERIIRKVVSFGFDELEGAVYESFVSGQPFLIKNIDIHPIMKIKGEDFFQQSTMQSYLCVPLVKSDPVAKCYTIGECPIMEKESTREAYNSNRSPYLTGPECLECPHNPLLGAIIVTDGFRAKQLTDFDQVALETVATLVSSSIENWNLYMDLKREEIFRENVIEGMINGVFAVDLDGWISLANSSAKNISQYQDSEVKNLKIKDVIYTDTTNKQDDSLLDTAIEEGATYTYIEAFLKRKDDVFVPIRMNLSPIYNEDGERQGIIIEFIDLSEIKKMEEEIRQLDRLAVLGRFTSAVAHEIRNPLTGIAAGIQYLDRSQELNADQKENISFILNEVSRLNRIVTDLFKVVKPRSLLYQRVSLEEIIEKSYRSVAEVFKEKNVEFVFNPTGDFPEIEADSDQLVQVFINLLKNAAEAVEENGKVQVNVMECSDTFTPKFSSILTGSMVCIEVVDNGVGIPPEDRGKVFEPFYSKKKGGTGLGLFITHSIVQHHGGRILIESEPGKGTKFIIHLPINKVVQGGNVEAGNSSGRR